MQLILSESYVTNTNHTLLYFISFFAVFFSIYIVISKNPIISVLFLIGLFFSVSVYLMTIGLHFLGLVYLIVYVGAVSILFLFILMLINVRISELLTDTNNSVLLAILTVFCFNFFAQDILPLGALSYDVLNYFNITIYLDFINNLVSSHVLNSANDIISFALRHLTLFNITLVNSKSWDGILVSLSHVTSIGNILYTNLVILFIITSLILLLAMVGAIIITINKSKNVYTLNY